MNRRDYLKAAGGLALGTALAGCSGDTKGEESDYKQISFEEAATNIEAYNEEKIQVEGHIRFEGQEEWGGDMLSTYHLFPDDPDQYDDPEDEMAHVNVMEEDFTPVRDKLTTDQLLEKESVEVELYGRAEPYGSKHSQPDEAFIEAHGLKLLETPGDQ